MLQIALFTLKRKIIISRVWENC